MTNCQKVVPVSVKTFRSRQWLRIENVLTKIMIFYEQWDQIMNNHLDRSQNARTKTCDKRLCRLDLLTFIIHVKLAEQLSVFANSWEEHCQTHANWEALFKDSDFAGDLEGLQPIYSDRSEALCIREIVNVRVVPISWMCKTIPKLQCSDMSSTIGIKEWSISLDGHLLRLDGDPRQHWFIHGDLIVAVLGNDELQKS